MGEGGEVRTASGDPAVEAFDEGSGGSNMRAEAERRAPVDAAAPSRDGGAEGAGGGGGGAGGSTRSGASEGSR